MLSAPSSEQVLEAIRKAASDLGKIPSRIEFISHSGISEYNVLSYFPSWVEAVRAAGLDIQPANVKLGLDPLLEDWGRVVRQLKRIPTRAIYRREGKYSPNTFDRYTGTWSAVPGAFRKWAHDKEQWNDVLALLPSQTEDIAGPPPTSSAFKAEAPNSVGKPNLRYSKLQDRPTYGNPIDFRGLRHEPVNENGVVFLFGMVARELGFLVEAVQAGFPDCEAKRQVGPGKWQRVRIEFEYESRNFRDHGHQPDGCDLIVCWRHNWPECPNQLQVIELSRVLPSLAASDD